MKKILVFGSINIDLVFQVPRIVHPGETIASSSMNRFWGGKGLNQSIAALRAGARAYHVGCVGYDGREIAEFLREEGVEDALLFSRDDLPTGQAIIQVDEQGENAIIIDAGANRSFPEALYCGLEELIDRDTLVLMQNETDGVDRVIELTRRAGGRSLFNPAPMNDAVSAYPLEKLDYLVLNEHESAALTGLEDPAEALLQLARQVPGRDVVITLGAEGALFPGRREGASTGEPVHLPAFPAKVRDTTAAGDTFIGYLAASIIEGSTMEEAVNLASRAAAFSTERPGASPSIPFRRELDTPIPGNYPCTPRN